jgi:hypothetical protein
VPPGFVTEEAGALHRVVAAPLGVGELLLQRGAVGRGLGRALPQGAQLALERRPLTLERAQRLRLGLQLLLGLAYLVPLLSEAPAHLLFGLGPSRELGADALVLRPGAVPVGRGRLLLLAGLLGAQLHLPPLLGGADPARGGVAQALGGERQVAFEAAELHPHRREPACDIGPGGLGDAAAPGGVLALVLGLAHPGTRAGEQPGQLGVAGLHSGRLGSQPVEQPPREGDLERELLLGQLDVALGLAALAGEASDLGLDLGDEVVHPLEVRGRFLQPALAAVLPVAVESDARGLLEQGPPFLGPVGEQQVDHLGLDDDAGVAAEPGTAEEVLDVAQPDRRAVEQVVALARAGESPGYHDLAIGDRQVAVAVVEIERDLGEVDRPAGGAALEDHVLHLAAPEEPGGLLAQHPAHGIGDVALAAPVGAHDCGDAALERKRNRVRERLEAGQLQPGQFHP